MDSFKRRNDLIQQLLSVEYAFDDNMSRDEREALDVERQMFCFRMGWHKMDIPELEHQVRAMGMDPGIGGD